MLVQKATKKKKCTYHDGKNETARYCKARCAEKNWGLIFFPITCIAGFFMRILCDEKGEICPSEWPMLHQRNTLPSATVFTALSNCDEKEGRGVSQKLTKSIFYLIRNCCYVVRKLTWGRGGVSQKLTKPDKGGRGGRKKANFN